ncbi:unnamed protein product [Phytophthora fragariaefolia]|uniref:Unnamed protein product n=1 Tax=Phytophthora fragariaefolia TaxID=1490495 RepID=A0A9W6TZ70_9STRA|nr:unnamed protein product [Phytophthora fragariaefolia]
MLEKNEAALKGWNALHKQQRKDRLEHRNERPSKTSPAEHKEWVRRCLIFRQQVGARLEVLASLADKQIAQEDEKAGGQRLSSAAGAAGVQLNPAMSAHTSAAAAQIQRQSSPAIPQQVYAPPQVSTMVSSNPMAMASSASMGSGAVPSSTVSTSASMAMPNMNAAAPPTLFPEPPMPTVGFASTSTSMFFPTGQMNPMQTSSGFSSTTSMPVSGVTTSTQGYTMSSGAQTFTPNAYMASTTGASNASAAFMSQPNYMMGGGMVIPQQQFMPMPMPMTMTSSGAGNMFGNNYGMASVPTSASSANTGSNNTSNSNFPVDPFMTPLGFGPEASFGSSNFPMAGMAGMSMQQQQIMASMSGGNFGAQGASMMPNNFGFGGMPGGPTSSAQNLMPQSLPTQQFQPPPGGLQPFPQQNQLSQHQPQQSGAGSMNMAPDSALYGDSNVNIFEGLTDDAFFPIQ